MTQNQAPFGLVEAWMTKPARSWSVLSALSAGVCVSLVLVTGCHLTATQFTCNEYPNPTAAQRTDVPTACSSGSGDLQEPAACPPAGFKGKCTRPDGPTVPGPYVERFYDGADVAYAQDFCVNTASGVWSTTF